MSLEELALNEVKPKDYSGTNENILRSIWPKLSNPYSVKRAGNEGSGLPFGVDRIYKALVNIGNLDSFITTSIEVDESRNIIYYLTTYKSQKMIRDTQLESRIKVYSIG